MSGLTRSKLLTMLVMQNKMNAKVNEEWLTAGYPWLRAVVVEGSEALEHYGWKWWKKQTPDMSQFKIELVDIWHFALSHTLVQRRGSISDAASSILEQLDGAAGQVSHAGNTRTFRSMGLLDMIELMISMAANRQFSFPLFAAIMDLVCMNWDDLLIGYVSKNVLNFFRQDNGYKAGTYVKYWFGEEDNVVLARIVKEMDITSTTFADDLYGKLVVVYADVLAVEAPPV